MSDVLVQTRLPQPIARVVQRRAEAEGDSIAGWIRRLIIKEVGSMRVGALVVNKRQADPQIVLRGEPRLHYYLQPLRDISAIERVFVLIHGPGSGGSPGTPVQKNGFMSSPAFQNPAEHRFLLESSPTPWAIVTAMYDETTRRTEVTLRAEPPAVA